jgi:hypothetical protein
MSQATAVTLSVVIFILGLALLVGPAFLAVKFL